MNLLKNFDRNMFKESLGLGLGQILLWGGSYFLLGILGKSIIQDLKITDQFLYGTLSFSILISGLVSPYVGKYINNKDRNYILLLSGILMGIGLLLLSISTEKILFVLSWILIGFAMGGGLYDALFASLGRKYGKNAPQSIIQITLISGFTTTLVWPLLTFLLQNYGWRNTCFVYGLLLIVLIFPIHYFSIFKFKPKEENDKVSIKKEKVEFKKDKMFYLLLINFSIGTFLMTGVYLHLIDILVNHRITMIEAVSIGTLLGPSQVGIRFLDMVLPKKTPIKTAIISATTILLGLLFLSFGAKVAFLGVILFGLGNGMRSILRGTLPLWIYGQESYATIIGKLARLPLIAQAITPLVSGYIIAYFGLNVFLDFLCLLAFISIIPMIIIYKKSVYRLKPNEI
jgi:MFS family permease